MPLYQRFTVYFFLLQIRGAMNTQMLALDKDKTQALQAKEELSKQKVCNLLPVIVDLGTLPLY